VKKLLSMSTTSFIRCGSISRYSGDVHDGYMLSWEDFGPFLKFAIRHRPLVEGNMIVPAASYEFTESIGDSCDDKVTHASVGRDSVKVNLDIAEIEKQFFEQRDESFKLPVGAVEIYLPHLKDVDIETIVKLRQHERDAFIVTTGERRCAKPGAPAAARC
jgi:hypothetical protein